MTPTRTIISELAQAHGVDAATIVRAAVVEFADGMSHMKQVRVLATVAKLDAMHSDKNCHSAPSEVTKNVTYTNPR